MIPTYAAIRGSAKACVPCVVLFFQIFLIWFFSNTKIVRKPFVLAHQARLHEAKNYQNNYYYYSYYDAYVCAYIHTYMYIYIYRSPIKLDLYTCVCQNGKAPPPPGARPKRVGVSPRRRAASLSEPAAPPRGPARRRGAPPPRRPRWSPRMCVCVTKYACHR